MIQLTTQPNKFIGNATSEALSLEQAIITEAIFSNKRGVM